MKRPLLIFTFCTLHFTFITWAAIPNTPGWHVIQAGSINTVCACTHGFPEVCGVEWCSAITADWNSGVFDNKRNRLIIWGGGHNGYYGNEIYALELTNPAMKRITDPGLPVATSCVEAIAGGTQPNSRHTGDGIVYMDHADRMFVQGGCPACPNGGFSGDTWTFNFTSMLWERRSPSGTRPRATTVVCDYDPNTKKVIVHDGYALFSYTLETDTYTRLAGNVVGSAYQKTSVIDPKRKKFFVFGMNEQSVWDISSGSSYAKQTFATTGGSAITGAYAPGLYYDPAGDRIIGWSGGNTVYTLDVDSRTWTAHTYSGGPGAQEQWGTYKRCGYSEPLGVFVVYNKTNQPGYAFRFPSAKGEQRADLSPARVSLSIWPNPVGKTAARISLIGFPGDDASHARIDILNLQGKTIRTLSQEVAGSGFSCKWDGNDRSGIRMSAGIYYVRVKAADFSRVKQILLLN